LTFILLTHLLFMSSKNRLLVRKNKLSKKKYWYELDIAIMMKSKNSLQFIIELA